MKEESPTKHIRKHAVLIGFVFLLTIADLWGWWACSPRTGNIYNATCVGDIKEPLGYKRVKVQDRSYATYLRSLPLKPAGNKMHLLRNVAHPLRNPWFILNDDGNTLHISVFSFAPEELRHY